MPVNVVRSTSLRLPANRVGRDFVVGDVGGDFDAVIGAMRDVAFDPSRDRVFSVGHLTGAPESISACLRFLRHPAVYAVRTDGEQDAIDLFSEGDLDDQSLAALGRFLPAAQWLGAVDLNARHQLLETIRHLPVAITVGEYQALYGFVHAGVQSDVAWETFVARVGSGEGEACHDALRGGIERAPGSVPGIGWVFICFSPDEDAGEANVAAVPPGPDLLPIKAASAAGRDDEECEA